MRQLVRRTTEIGRSAPRQLPPPPVLAMNECLARILKLLLALAILGNLLVLLGFVFIKLHSSDLRVVPSARKNPGMLYRSPVLYSYRT